MVFNLRASFPPKFSASLAVKLYIGSQKNLEVQKWYGPRHAQYGGAPTLRTTGGKFGVFCSFVTLLNGVRLC